MNNRNKTNKKLETILRIDENPRNPWQSTHGYNNRALWYTDYKKEHTHIKNDLALLNTELQKYNNGFIDLYEINIMQPTWVEKTQLMPKEKTTTQN